MMFFSEGSPFCVIVVPWCHWTPPETRTEAAAKEDMAAVPFRTMSRRSEMTLCRRLKPAVYDAGRLSASPPQWVLASGTQCTTLKVTQLNEGDTHSVAENKVDCCQGWFAVTFAISSSVGSTWVFCIWATQLMMWLCIHFIPLW